MTDGNAAAYPSEQTAWHPTHQFAEGDKIPTDGMTKRELFAAMAMQGMLAGQAIWSDAQPNTVIAVRWADALIDALNK